MSITEEKVKTVCDLRNVLQKYDIDNILQFGCRYVDGKERPYLLIIESKVVAMIEP